jgi:hypothetical protein
MIWAGNWRPRAKGRNHSGRALYRTGLHQRLKQCYDCFGQSNEQLNKDISEISAHDSIFTFTADGKNFLLKKGDVVKAGYRADWSPPLLPLKDAIYTVQGQMHLLSSSLYMMLYVDNIDR